MDDGPDDGLLAPELEWWQAWRHATGATIPDFSSLPSRPFLPPLLERSDGSKVTSAGAWSAHRQTLWQNLCHYFFGRFPDQAPALLRADTRSEEQTYGTVCRRVDLTFAARDQEVTFNLDVILPAELPQGTLPLFLTQSSHRSWAALAASRGYAAGIYPAGDDDDQSGTFAAVYPELDWATIPRRAWLACRALDYLLTLPQVDSEKVAITGHSRNGKQALIAAALDPRITAVISSSSGSGGCCAFRLASEAHFAESVEFMTRRFPDWFHPRLRFFTGREDQLPVDIHALIGLIAPRPCLLSTALNDSCETGVAVERTYLAAREVYRLLDAPEALNIRWRAGEHGTGAEDIHAYVDWCDAAFGRAPAQLPSPPRLYAVFAPTAWREAQAGSDGELPEPLPWPAARQEVQQAVRWSLGSRPPLRREFGSRYGAEMPHHSQLMNRYETPEGVSRLTLQFSDYVPGDLYHPTDAQAPLPAVIWLHPHSYPKGYRGAYMVGEPIYHVLAKAGFAVFAFDLPGYGRRIDEGRAFYRRHPAWSKLDRMVRDVQGAVDVLEDQADYAPVAVKASRRIQLPPLALDHIYCLGYGLGSWVALYATALEPRLAGFAAFCDLSPLRSGPQGAEHDALTRLSTWHGLVPRLSHFAQHRASAPYDLEHLLALVAPRPCLIVSPTHDRFVRLKAVKTSIGAARHAFRETGAGQLLEHHTPRDYHRFQPPQHETALAWLRRVTQAR